MSAEFSCDGCGKKQTAEFYDGHFHVPTGWFTRMMDIFGHAVPLTCCSKECSDVAPGKVFDNLKIEIRNPVLM